ncbi:MAG: ATP-binding protein [Polyangiaceae bacterium]
MCLEVADTGTGMTAEVRARALEPFFTTRDGSRGTGLGLATVDRIARGYGGRVEIVSALSAGTRVRVHFPRPS